MLHLQRMPPYLAACDVIFSKKNLFICYCDFRGICVYSDFFLRIINDENDNESINCNINKKYNSNSYYDNVNSNNGNNNDKDNDGDDDNDDD